MSVDLTAGRLSSRYHIHIHLKKGVEFLEAELHSVTRHHK